MQKNVASQKWRVFAFDRTTNAPLTGDAANITAKISKDFGAATATNDVNPTEVEDGYYEFDLTQAETNADDLLILPQSATANIVVVGCPARIATTPAAWSDDVVQTGDSFARIGTNGVGLTSLATATALATAQNDLDVITGADGVNLLSATQASIDAIEVDTTEIGAAGAGLTAIPWNASWDAEVQSEVTDALNAALTEAYRSTGATGSVAQLLYEIIAHLGESAIVSTTKTLKKLDGSTTAKVYTLDSATTPTSITETS